MENGKYFYFITKNRKKQAKRKSINICSSDVFQNLVMLIRIQSYIGNYFFYFLQEFSFQIIILKRIPFGAIFNINSCRPSDC